VLGRRHLKSLRSLERGAQAMNRLRPRRCRRRMPERACAMTLLETVLAMTLLTVITLFSAQAVRVTWQAWDIQDQRSDRFQHLDGALTHITRHLRAARSIVEVSDPADTSGYLAITRPDDSVVKWDHDAQYIRYGVDTPTHLLARDIDELTFECFEIDGVTPTTVLADIRMIRTTVSITVPGQGVPFSLSSTVWMRKQLNGLAAEFVDFHAHSSSTPIGWNDHGNITGPPDGLFGSGPQGAMVRAFGFDPSGYSGSIGTVLVGLYLRTDNPIGDDFLDVQAYRGSLGPLHPLGQAVLLRFDNNTGWVWVDITNDFGSWTYEDLGSVRVDILNNDAGSGGSIIRLDSVKLRTFETAPSKQTFRLTVAGTAFNEWNNISGAVGPPDGVFARSYIFSIPASDIDRQDYSYAQSWKDLGTIVRVRLLISDFYVSATVVDDEFHARLPSTTEPGETQDTPPPDSAEMLPITLLNQHIGSANPGTVYLDLTNIADWTWTEVRSRFVRFYMSATGTPEAEIYIDSAGLDVRYVPPNTAGVVLWEEL